MCVHARLWVCTHFSYACTCTNSSGAMYNTACPIRRVLSEIRALLLFWACIVCTWLWGALHMAYSQAWMLALFCIFNTATVSAPFYVITRRLHPFQKSVASTFRQIIIITLFIQLIHSKVKLCSVVFTVHGIQ